MKEFFSKDKPIVGVVAGVASMLGLVLVLSVGLLLFGLQPAVNLKLYVVTAVPPMLLLQRFAHRGTQPRATKALIATTFVGFVLILIVLLRTNAIALK